MPACRKTGLPVVIKLSLKPWLPVMVWMCLIFFNSSIPGSKIPSLFRFQDIVFHLFAYFILALLFSRALKNTFLNINSFKIIIFTVIFSVVYGISDELHQVFVPDREFASFDIIIDGIGSFLGALVYPFKDIFVTA
jgi:VanZ family protein